VKTDTGLAALRRIAGRYRGEMWALVSAFCYAFNTLFIRLAVRDYDVDHLMGVVLRALPTFLFTTFMGWRLGRRDTQAVSPFSRWRLALLLVTYGILTFAIANPLHFLALRTGGVLVATPVTGTQVLWSGIIAALFLHQPLNAPMIGGLITTVGGIGLLALGQGSGTPASPNWWLAIPLALGVALGWAGSGTLIAAAMQRGVDRFRALAVATGTGILLLNLYLGLTGRLDVYLTTPLPALGSLAMAGLLNAVALVSITTALSLTNVANAVTINTLQTGLAPLLAWLILGEQPNGVTALGILLIVAGVVVVQRSSPVVRHSRAEKEEGA
jgi:drug/metabolite transporter (DMT)-like permease